MKYISPNDLAEIILDQSMVVGKDYLIIDVRGDDYPFGNIIQARNIPSHEFMDRIQEYYNELKDVKIIIFHCA
jgi:rhodanese-related sulfurtransferase